MRTPIKPVPDAVERWVSRVRYLRWLDALLAGAVLWAVVALALADLAGDVQVLVALLGLGMGMLLPPLRARWRPGTACAGLAVSRHLRPGDRAWWIGPDRAERVLVTARRGPRLIVAPVQRGAAETVSVRRTRALIIPADAAGRAERRR